MLVLLRAQLLRVMYPCLKWSHILLLLDRCT